MPTITMLVGLPASGKSTWAKLNAEKLNAIVISSDQTREMLYGNESTQGNPNEVFELVFRNAKTLLSHNNNVIIDATNVSRKKRINFNNEFNKYTRNAVYFNSSLQACMLRDENRERQVGSKVINRMFKELQVPTYSEGWDSIEIIYDDCCIPFSHKENIENKILNDWSYEDMFGFPYGLGQFHDFIKIYELPHDNPHHVFSVSRHTYHVYKYIYDNYKYQETFTTSDFLVMLWSALLHDVGKGYTKSFKDYRNNPSIIAHYYNHENISGQIACSILHSLGYDDNFILKVVEIVQLHMALHNLTTTKSIKKFKKNVSEDVFDKLVFFTEADTISSQVPPKQVSELIDKTTNDKYNKGINKN